MPKSKHPVEIEAKIKINEDQASEITALLASEGYPYEGMEELNTYFDRDGKIKSKGQALRLRRLLDGGNNSTHSAVFTFKGPIHKDVKLFKSRPETEVRLTNEDADRMELILLSLGYKPSFMFNKKRAEFKLPKATVCIDYLPGLGHFLEVEGENEKAINSILKELGMVQFKPIKKGYPSLLEEHAKKIPRLFLTLKRCFSPQKWVDLQTTDRTIKSGSENMPNDNLAKIIDQRNQFVAHAQNSNPGMKMIWEDEDWKLIRVKKKVFNLKLGKLIFDYQDLTIGKKPMHSSLPKIDGIPWMQAYSPRIGQKLSCQTN